MKNIHLIPTEKASRLFKFEDTLIKNDLIGLYDFKEKGYEAHHIYITSDENVKEGDYCISHLNIIDEGKIHNSQTIFNPKTKEHLILLQSCKKIILTTDPDLIADGVQAIDDEFLEWFVKNPSCEEVEIVEELKYFNLDELRERYLKGLPHLYSESIGYKIIIPQEEPKQEFCDNCGNEVCCCVIKNLTALDEAAEKYSELQAGTFTPPHKTTYKHGFEDGAKWQAERRYSEEDMISFAEFVATYTDKNKNVHGQMLHAKSKYDGAERTIDLLKIWFEKHKKK
jgi:hypothetical protein